VQMEPTQLAMLLDGIDLCRAEWSLSRHWGAFFAEVAIGNAYPQVCVPDLVQDEHRSAYGLKKGAVAGGGVHWRSILGCQRLHAQNSSPV
jgi:hypothetical protein